MLKFCGILCVVAACAGSGIYLACRLRQQVGVYRNLLAFLEDCAIYIRYQNLPLQELFSLLAENPDYRHFDFLQTLQKQNFCEAETSPDMTMERCWYDAVQDSKLPAEAKRILQNMGHALGKTDTQGQLAVIALYQTQMQTAHAQSKEACEKKSRLYQALGWLGGAMLAILLI